MSCISFLMGLFKDGKASHSLNNENDVYALAFTITRSQPNRTPMEDDEAETCYCFGAIHNFAYLHLPVCYYLETCVKNLWNNRNCRLHLFVSLLVLLFWCRKLLNWLNDVQQDCCICSHKQC